MNDRQTLEQQIDGLTHEISEIVRVARDNPGSLIDYIKCNFPKEWGMSKEEHRTLVDTTVSRMKTDFSKLQPFIADSDAGPDSALQLKGFSGREEIELFMDALIAVEVFKIKGKH